ncbi:MAG: hypothetical protein IKV53_00025 [Clostridia bacterium]|nr:hypothetical protein [Clostridia bacterium]
MKVLSFGEILWDVYPDKKYIGGAPLNFAAHLARHGGDVEMLSAVGCDFLGDEALEILGKWGVGTHLVKRLPDKETGSCVVTLDESSTPSYNLKTDVAWDCIPHIDTKTFDVLYFGTLALRGEHNRISLNKTLESGNFREIFCDINLRAPFFDRDSIEMVLNNATILKISEEELDTTLAAVGVENTGLESVCLELESRYKQIRVVIITLGSKGAVAHSSLENRLYFVKAKPCSVVSTVGAGDSFSAAFLWSYMRGEGVDRCLSHASEIAALTVSCYDAVPEYTV